MIPSFSGILNPSINYQDKLIYAKRTADKTTFYEIIEFKNNEFISARTFGWYSADLDFDKVPDADKLAHCEETSGPDYTVVKDFYVSLDGSPYNLDMNDKQIKPYYKKGSLWDLNSSKWECEFYKDLKEYN